MNNSVARHSLFRWVAIMIISMLFRAILSLYIANPYLIYLITDLVEAAIYSILTYLPKKDEKFNLVGSSKLFMGLSSFLLVFDLIGLLFFY